MLNERPDGRMHPFVERQSAQKSVEFRLAAGAIEAEDRRLTGADGGLPQPDEVPPVRQCLCRGSFCPLAVFDLGLRNTVRDIQLEFDEKLHQRLLAARDSHLVGAVIGTLSSSRCSTNAVWLERRGDLATEQLPCCGETSEDLETAGCCRSAPQAGRLASLRKLSTPDYTSSGAGPSDVVRT